MKTKIILFAVICMFFFAENTVSQNYFYNSSTLFQESGFTYRCSKDSYGIVSLRNDSNVFTNVKYAFKDGAIFEEEAFFNSYVQLVEDDNWTKLTSFSIINNAFPVGEKQRVVNKSFDINLTIDTNTGRVMEVDFGFLYNSPFATIPISTYRKIEMELKQRIWFTPTDTGRRLNHLKLGWVHKVE